MTPAPTLSFQHGVSLAEATHAQVTIDWPGGSVTLKDLSPAVLAALFTLKAGGATHGELCARALATDGPIASTLLHHQLRWCDQQGLLCYTIFEEATPNRNPLAIVVPMAAGFVFSARAFAVDTRFQLSRFTYCRRDGDSLLIESPLSLARTILPGRTGAGLVAELAQPRTRADLSAAVEDVSEGTADTFLNLLANAGVIAEVDSDGKLREDEDPALMQWEFHDLVFHSRSRMGRHDYPFGGTFPFRDRIAPLAAVKPRMSDEVIPLSRADMALLEREDRPLTRVLEHRRSIREHGNPPISAQQLGEFLFRVARVRQIREPDPEHGLHYQASSRPYPSGGASYDLELYVTVHDCADIPAGLYHYNPQDHLLYKVADRTGHIDMLLRDAQQAAALSSMPQVLITLASRFQRLSWKYRSIAYATTLKNVGVMYQTMYLVATAMELAPCALGGGNSALFAAAAGTEYSAESSVGEFILGSRHP
jgi:SagB-type dehydrogenase family enzyme